MVRVGQMAQMGGQQKQAFQQRDDQTGDDHSRHDADEFAHDATDVKQGMNAMMVVTMAAMTGIPTSETPSTAAFKADFPCLRCT
jgi:Pyruvate/2-oxoacid:ferredoxin oxidoreductase gamma subunit